MLEDIIYCKDCEFYHPVSELVSECGNIRGLLDPSETDFCSHGKQKQDVPLDGQIRLES